MEMTTVKTVAVFAIIFGCFAVLYPKIFHPMLLHLLGMAPSRRSADDTSKNLWTHPPITTRTFKFEFSGFGNMRNYGMWNINLRVIPFLVVTW